MSIFTRGQFAGNYSMNLFIGKHFAGSYNMSISIGTQFAGYLHYAYNHLADDQPYDLNAHNVMVCCLLVEIHHSKMYTIKAPIA